MVFLWPMPFLDNIIAFPLRVLMSKLAYYSFNIIGLSCVQAGTAVVSASDPALGLREGQRFAVDVADPCSGIRSLFALCMVTALYGYFIFPKTWQKIVLFLCAAPLAVLGNWLRILMLTLGTIYMGADVAIGSIDKPTTFHMAAGFVVFAGALAGMLVISYILEKLDGAKTQPPKA
jgi:exosortase